MNPRKVKLTTERAGLAGPYPSMIAIGRARPEWGHALLTPLGDEIRVPRSVFPILRRLGVLQGNAAQLTTRIYALLDQDYDCLTDGLRLILGANLEGPTWCVCKCRACQSKASDLDHSRLSQVRLEQKVEEVTRCHRR